MMLLAFWASWPLGIKILFSFCCVTLFIGSLCYGGD